jgi:hypothetical protein
MSARAWVVVGGLVLIVVLILATGRIGPIELLLLLVLVGGAAAIVGGRGGVLRFETSAAPAEVTATAITLVATHRRWATLSQTESAVTFAYHRPPSKLLAFLLLLCFLVPGIVYLVLAGKRESLSIATTVRDERTAVQATANGWRGRQASRALERQLSAVIPTSPARTPA